MFHKDPTLPLTLESDEVTAIIEKFRDLGTRFYQK